jgi:N-sulfoglucosamine sulfohydrolase
VPGLGYPARGIRDANFLYGKNFVPDRWPCCDPDRGLSDTDAGPARDLIAASGEQDRYWQLCFGKRPAEEFYDLAGRPLGGRQPHRGR